MSINLVVGQKVTLKRPVMRELAGATGFVYEEYGDKGSVSVIFERGSYDGFSVEDQDLCFIIGEVDLRYADYEFKNVNQVYNDWQNGYWNFS